MLENVGPRQSIILARLSGGPLAETGVLQGMSGSPVYIDGKLAGAVALGFSESKVAIAGIRPIEEMLRVEPEDTTTSAALAAVRPAASFVERRNAPRRNCHAARVLGIHGGDARALRAAASRPGSRSAAGRFGRRESSRQAGRSEHARARLHDQRPSYVRGHERERGRHGDGGGRRQDLRLRAPLHGDRSDGPAVCARRGAGAAAQSGELLQDFPVHGVDGRDHRGPRHGDFRNRGPARGHRAYGHSRGEERATT